MIKSRVTIALLSVLGGSAAGLVGAVSLTRIATDQLGFPGGLEWTLTAAVDIGATAGAVMWSSAPGHQKRIRGAGMRLNIACSSISALGVGLDHSVHADHGGPGWWPYVAFFIGAYLPLLSTWLIHSLAKLTEDVEDGAQELADEGQEPAEDAQEPVMATVVSEAAPEPEQAPADKPGPARRPVRSRAGNVRSLAAGAKRGDVVAALRAAYWELANEAMSNGRGLDSIRPVDVDVRAGVTKGSAKKRVTAFREEFESEVTHGNGTTG